MILQLCFKAWLRKHYSQNTSMIVKFNFKEHFNGHQFPSEQSSCMCIKKNTANMNGSASKQTANVYAWFCTSWKYLKSKPISTGCNRYLPLLEIKSDSILKMFNAIFPWLHFKKLIVLYARCGVLNVMHSELPE